MPRKIFEIFCFATFLQTELDGKGVLPNHGDHRKSMNMKKCFAFLATSVALGSFGLIADYVAQDFISPKTGKSTIFWGDASRGKDAYILEYDKEADKYYFEKIEKNKPSSKASEPNAVPASAK